MKRALYLLDQLRDVVQGKPGPEVAEVASRHLEGLPRAGDASARQPASQRLVDDVSEGPARASRLSLELRHYIIVERERGPHALMLVLRHLDVNPDLRGGDGMKRPTSRGAVAGASSRSSKPSPGSG